MLLILSTESGGLGITDTARKIYGKLIPQAVSSLLKGIFRGRTDMTKARQDSKRTNSTATAIANKINNKISSNNSIDNDVACANWYEEFRSEKLSDRVRLCREHLEWSQEKLAEQAQISTRTVSRIECGAFPQIDTLSRLEISMCLPCGYLYAPAQSGLRSGLSEYRKECLEIFINEVQNLSPSLSDEQFNDFLDDWLMSMRRTAKRNKHRKASPGVL